MNWITNRWFISENNGLEGITSMAFNRSKKIEAISLSSAYPQNVTIVAVFAEPGLFILLSRFTATG
ncbi:hypothetical protein HA42_20225 [Pantoea deleyi]|nr:hypothetical protein HA42_20225 [Pantoea deleyi]